MKLTLSWKEFKKYAMIGLSIQQNKTFTDDFQFLKDYGTDGVGEMYDYPDIVTIELPIK